MEIDYKSWVQLENLHHLTVGDRIKNKQSGQVYIIISDYENIIVAAKTIQVDNIKEWEVLL